jgi:hypothetical protein
MPRVWRGRLRPFAGAELLVVIATIAFVAGIVLAIGAADLSLAGDVPLWDVAFVVCALAVLASVIAFPQWWAWTGGAASSRRLCAGARTRRASHTVDLRRARSPHARRRPDRPAAHRTARRASGGPLRPDAPIAGRAAAGGAPARRHAAVAAPAWPPARLTQPARPPRG